MIKIKFPMFPDRRMVGLIACGNLLTASGEVKKKIDELHKSRPFISYQANRVKIHAHILGGKYSSPHHLHIDIFKLKLLKLDKVRIPEDTMTQEMLINELNLFIGQPVQVKYTGIFLIPSATIPKGGLIQPIRIDDENDAERRIEMNSASYELTGFPVRHLRWTAAGEDFVRIDLSYIEELNISQDYLTAPQTIFTQQLEYFVFGGNTNANH